jgi:hypothetical protein
MAWSIDIDSYDYRRSSGAYMLQRVLNNLEKRNGGILLMHDMQPKTAMMLPTLLANLKKRGFRIVHVVPAEQGTKPGLVARARDDANFEGASAMPVKRHRHRVKQVNEPAQTFHTVFNASLR